MAQVHEAIEIAAAVEIVWAIGGNLAGIVEWVPFIATCRVEGDRRTVTLGDGRAATERILNRDPKARTYEYEFLEGAFPYVSYRSRLSVTDAPAGSCVDWHGDVQGDGTMVEDELVASIAQAYREALSCLRDIAEAREIGLRTARA